mmetsp:Transcript_50971/g.59562  ORF Transcript_50971/g.59562 Transcript_50971/m.59562 type:complete len:85 (+) Transcript_50971:521-775(+)
MQFGSTSLQYGAWLLGHINCSIPFREKDDDALQVPSMEHTSSFSMKLSNIVKSIFPLEAKVSNTTTIIGSIVMVRNAPTGPPNS